MTTQITPLQTVQTAARPRREHQALDERQWRAWLGKNEQRDKVKFARRVRIIATAPVDFTVHIKALQDFDTKHPLVVRLLPVLGRGSARFARPDTTVVSGKPVVKADGERIVITMKKTDEAARVIVNTEYPADWWAGFTKVRVDVGETMPAHSVEASVIVADRVPTSWQRFV